jgi:hypothetical protein
MQRHNEMVRIAIQDSLTREGGRNREKARATKEPGLLSWPKPALMLY